MGLLLLHQRPDLVRQLRGDEAVDDDVAMLTERLDLFVWAAWTVDWGIWGSMDGSARDNNIYTSRRVFEASDMSLHDAWLVS